MTYFSRSLSRTLSISNKFSVTLRVQDRECQLYLENRKQLVSLNGMNSGTQIMKHGIPHGSVVGPLLFLTYLNDPHNAIVYSQPYHFADDTNLLCISNSPKNVQKTFKLTRKFCITGFLLIKSH